MCDYMDVTEAKKNMFANVVGSARKTVNNKKLVSKVPLESSTELWSKHSLPRSDITDTFPNKIVHKDVWVCQSCGRQFQFKCLLFKHQLSCVSCHKRKIYHHEWQKNDSSRERNYVPEEKKRWLDSPSDEMFDEAQNEAMVSTFCDICDKNFTSFQQYKLHREKNLCFKKHFVCMECKENFSTLDDLRIHKYYCKAKFSPIYEETPVRQKQKNFCCRCCERKFQFPELLKAHLDENNMCEKVHHLSIKVEHLSKKSTSSNLTARKSVSKSVSDFDDHHKSISKSYIKSKDLVLPSPVGGSARKSFHSSFSSSVSNDEENVCKICDMHFTSSFQLQVHEESHFQKDNFWMVSKCPQCKEVFSDSHQLFQHQAELDHYGKATKSMMSTCKCPFCDKKFLHVEMRNAHLRCHADRKSHEIKEFISKTTCDICYKTFGSEVLKTQHLRTIHSYATSNSSSEKLADFEETAKPQQYVGYATKLKVYDKVPDAIKKKLKKVPNACPICNKVYDSSFLRNRHFRLHILDGSYECEYCFLKFPRAERLANHVQLAHKEFLKYECKECGSRYPTRLRILQHVTKAHSEYPVSELIQECGVSSTSLEVDPVKKEPITDRNSNETAVPDSKFYCHVCELSFLKLCGLSRHNQSKLHKDLLQARKEASKMTSNSILQLQLPPRAMTPPVVDYSQPFTCSECAEEFSSVHDFIPHRLSHFSKQNEELFTIPDIKPYTCEVCGKLMNNHQKIQLHLFWHLQDVQSQPVVKGNKAKKGILPVPHTPKPVIHTSVPEELVGQAVAKKTISKTGKQELVIGGVKTLLFTCKNCGIGFTTQRHYVLHVRKYCRGQLKAVSENEIDECNENGQMTIKCSKCDGLFEDKNTFSVHEQICNKSEVGCTFCTMCHCLFSSFELYTEHKKHFCVADFVAIIDENTLYQNVEVLKLMMKLDSDIMACVQCNSMFSSVEKLSQHMNTHKMIVPNKNKNKSSSITSVNNIEDSVDSDAFDENSFSEQEKSSYSDSVENEPFSDSELLENSDSQHSNIIDAPNMDDDNAQTGDISQDNSSISQDDESAEESDDEHGEYIQSEITKLRQDFSRLLTVLVSDSDLMKQLGFGQRTIDDVLVSVMEKMSLTPVKCSGDDPSSVLQTLRCNIRNLLEVCIKDQIMELIADRKATTEEIVATALKMFAVE